MPKKLTDLSIRSLGPGLHMDGRTPAFGIRVGKLRKTWIVTKGTNRTKVRLGHYPALSLSEARKRALVALGSPLEPREAPSFPDALATFLALPRWKHRSLKVLTSSLNHFKWTRPIDRITHEDVAEVIDGIDGHSAKAHALKDIRTFFNWCIPRYLSTSPATGIKLPPTRSRERVLTDDELRRVWLAAEDSPHPFNMIVKLLILTGQRKSEIGTLRWDCIKIGLSITFPETKNGREHTIPISSYLENLLRSVPATGSSFIFLRPMSDALYSGWARHTKDLQSRSGTNGWTIHDLRRTFATGLASLNVPIHVTEKLLNHISGSLGGVAGIYNRFDYWKEQKAALKAWETRVLSIARQAVP